MRNLSLKIVDSAHRQLSESATQAAGATKQAMDMQRQAATMGIDVEQQKGYYGLQTKGKAVSERVGVEKTMAALQGQTLQYGIQGVADMKKTQLAALQSQQGVQGAIAQTHLGTAQQLAQLGKPDMGYYSGAISQFGPMSSGMKGSIVPTTKNPMYSNFATASPKAKPIAANAIALPRSRS